MSFDINNLKIGIVGLGYVGLPLAAEFGRHYPTVGFDINEGRIESSPPASSSIRPSLMSKPTVG